MFDRRSERTTAAARTLAALGAVALLVPLAPLPALAGSGWLRQELDSADRIGLVLEAGTLRPDGTPEAGDGISSRWETVPRHTGLAVFPEQPLDAPTDTVDVRVRADGDPEEVLTELRGVRPDGMWTEWHPAGTGGGRVTLPHDVSRVQLRVEVEGEENGLTGLRIRPVETDEDDEPADHTDDTDDTDPTDGTDTAVHDEPFSAVLFATRIGLVGDITANGHRIRERDYFVALPSRRGLALRGGGEYTVRVCTTGLLGPEGRGETEGHRSRCAYLPVWDVGPWNIRDDHWNAERESWHDLERGRPQAQAAYVRGYNGGLDGFGRRVLNPAGIDLADGAFRHALGLPTNGWVRVDYLWTGEYRWRARITGEDQREPVVVRAGPGPEYAPVGLAAHSANVDVACQTVGGKALGTFGTGRVWYRIGEGHYVPAVSADGGAGAPDCAEP